MKYEIVIPSDTSMNKIMIKITDEKIQKEHGEEGFCLHEYKSPPGLSSHTEGHIASCVHESCNLTHNQWYH